MLADCLHSTINEREVLSNRSSGDYKGRSISLNGTLWHTVGMGILALEGSVQPMLSFICISPQRLPFLLSQRPRPPCFVVVLQLPLSLAMFSQSSPVSYYYCARDPYLQSSGRPMPDDSKVIQKTKITPKVVVWRSIVLFNHKIFSKHSYDVMIITSCPLETFRIQNTQNYCPEQCVCGGVLFT